LSSPTTVCLWYVSWAMEAPLLSQVEHLLGYYCSVLRASMLPWSIVLQGIFCTCAFVVLIVLLVQHLNKFVWRLVSRLILSPLADIKTWACLLEAVGLLLHTAPWSCHPWGSVWFVAGFCSHIEFLVMMVPHVPRHIP